MKSTVITHIYNEEFLLDSWLRHHREIFEHGIVVDFDSTDNSLEIVRDLAPDWKIIPSPLKEFSAAPLDRLIESVEGDIHGVKMALTVTEFLLGNPSEMLDNQLIVPSVDLVNMPTDAPFDASRPWHEQRKHGIHYQSKTKNRDFPRGRSIHNFSLDYPIGRHFVGLDGGPMLIYKVAGCLVREEMISRRLQIQHKIPITDIEQGLGFQHHNSGLGLTRENVLEQESYEISISVNLEKVIDSAVRRMQIGSSEAGNSTPVKSMVAERDSLVTERDSLVTERSSLVAERDSLVTERDSLVAERDSLVAERDSLVAERDSLVTEREAILNSLSWRTTKPVRRVLSSSRKLYLALGSFWSR